MLEGRDSIVLEINKEKGITDLKVLQSLTPKVKVIIFFVNDFDT